MKKFFCSAIVFVFITACSRSDDPAKYTGVWHRVKYPNETVTVTVDSGSKLIFTEPLSRGSDKNAEGQHGEIVGDRVVFSPMLTATISSTGVMFYDQREFKR